MIERINWKCVMVIGVAIAVLYSLAAQARDLDGRYSNSPYKQWFDAQRNGQGTSCCHEGDAHRYDGNYTFNPDGSVTVTVDGKPHVLPGYMVLKGANPTGSAIWWFREWSDGSRTDFCFAPGTLS